MTRATVRTAHEIPERLPLQLEPGEQVDVGRRDTEWPAFVFVTASHGTGWVPARHLSADAGPATVQTAYDTTELPTVEGESLTVLEVDEDSAWCWCRNTEGRTGWVPTRTLDLDT